MNTLTQLLLESSLRIALAAAAAGLFLQLARVRSGAVRHTVWLVVLCGMLLMPALQFSMPAVPVPLPQVQPFVPPQFATDAPAPSATAVIPTEPPARATAPSSVSVPPRRPVDWTTFALSIYAAGIALSLLRLLLGWRTARRVLRTCSAVPQTGAYESTLLATPVTIGVWTPRIVLPGIWREWSAEKLAAILAHERAHVVRRDGVVTFLAHLNRSIFWFHPLAWWLQRALATASELACDEAGVRATSDERRYAGIVLEIAADARRAGGRYSWQATGMEGAGRIGKRIDRILAGAAAAHTSRFRRTAVIAACALAVIAAACRRLPPPLKDEASAVSVEEQNKLVKALWNVADAITTPQQVAELEARLRSNPEDTNTREKLMVFYVRHPNVLGKQATLEARHAHVLWLIEHHPDSPLARQYATAGVGGESPERAEARRLWLAQAEWPDANARTLMNAARFLASSDPASAERFASRAQQLDPLAADSPYCAEVAYRYVFILGLPPAEWRATKAAKARIDAILHTLAETHDDLLLGTVGELLMLWGAMPQRAVREFDPMELGKSYVERALQLNPQCVPAHRALLQLRTAEDRRWQASIPGGLPPEKRIELQYQQVLLIPGDQRARQMAEVAESAYRSGDQADYSTDHQYFKTDAESKAAARSCWDHAGQYAQEALKLAAQHPQDPDYGTVVYRANTILGMVAQRHGNRKAAVKYMLAAAEAPATEQLQYALIVGFGHKLAQWLLKDGERETVAEFFDRSAKVSIANRDQLHHWASQIRAGIKPFAL